MGIFIKIEQIGCHRVAPPRHVIEKQSTDFARSRCDDCHKDKEYSYPEESTFRESYGHGGVACVNCHAATHLANQTSIGYNTCARACHTTQPYDSKMGPDCGKCHNSSVAPHLVKKQP